MEQQKLLHMFHMHLLLSEIPDSFEVEDATLSMPNDARWMLVQFIVPEDKNNVDCLNVSFSNYYVIHTAESIAHFAVGHQHLQVPKSKRTYLKSSFRQRCFGAKKVAPIMLRFPFAWCGSINPQYLMMVLWKLRRVFLVVRYTAQENPLFQVFESHGGDR
jgi:hypothetical protein